MMAFISKHPFLTVAAVVVITGQIIAGIAATKLPDAAFAGKKK